MGSRPACVTPAERRSSSSPRAGSGSRPWRESRKRGRSLEKSDTSGGGRREARAGAMPSLLALGQAPGAVVPARRRTPASKSATTRAGHSGVLGLGSDQGAAGVGIGVGAPGVWIGRSGGRCWLRACSARVAWWSNARRLGRRGDPTSWRWSAAPSWEATHCRSPRTRSLHRQEDSPGVSYAGPRDGCRRRLLVIRPLRLWLGEDALQELGGVFRMIGERGIRDRAATNLGKGPPTSARAIRARSAPSPLAAMCPDCYRSLAQ